MSSEESIRPPPAATGAPVRSPPWLRWSRVALVVAFGVLAYSNTFDVPFQFDDQTIIGDDVSMGGVGAFLSRPHSPQRFLAYLSFAANGSMGGRDPFGFHVVNLLIHLATALCVGVLAAAVMRHAFRFEPEGAERAAWGGTLAAILFVVHPLHTQAVTYVIQRMASMAALFALAAALAHVKSLEHPWGTRRAAWVALVLVLTAAACLTKENTVVLPGLLILVDLAAAEGSPRERIARLAPYLVLPVAAVALFGARDLAAGVSTEFREWSVQGMSDRSVYLLTQPRVLLTYLRLLILPVAQNFDYEYPAVSSAASAAFLGSVSALLVIFLGAAAVAARWGRSQPVAWLGIFAVAWFALALSVESSVFPLSDLINEHRVYLPSVGPLVAVAAGLAFAYGRLQARGRVGLLAACALAIAVLAFATWRRNELWRDPCAFWGDVVAKSPGKGRPYAWLAQCLEQKGQSGRAMELLEHASRLPRAGPHALLGLARLQERQGDPLKALETYDRAWAEGAGAYPDARQGRGLALLALGRTAEACSMFEEELGARPGSRAARQNVANCRFERGDVAGALAEWTTLAAEPGADPEAFFNLAVGQAASGDAAGARRSYEAFLRVAGTGLTQERSAAESWLAANPR